MSRPAPRRRAEPPARRRRAERVPRAPLSGTAVSAPAAPPVVAEPDASVTPVTPAGPAEPRVTPAALTRRERLVRSRSGVVAWLLVVAAGLGVLVACLLDVGPGWLCGAGAIAVVSAYAAALAVRTGGRGMVSGGLALLLGVATVVSGDDVLRTGAAVLTAVVSAVLAVMLTVPAVRLLQAIREVVLALVIAGVGALAVVGFEPVVSVGRFEYLTLGLAFVGVLALVYRLGAGLHGLGRRGVVIVVLGTVVLAVTLAYAELLRRYGTPSLVTHMLEVVVWSREHLGASPRPLETVLGVPALLWGVHMRARRRQGWWVCAFGVAATVPVADALVNPAISLEESALAVAYGAVVGLVLGFVVIRLDLAITGPRGKRGRRAEEAAAGRPEPSRTRPLL